MTPGSDPPPIPYLSVYRLAIPTPEVNTPLGTFGGVGVGLIRGPFAVERSIPLLAYGPRSASMVLGAETVRFPKGAFLVMDQGVDITSVRGSARLRAAELAALLEIRFERIIQEKVFEGPVNTPIGSTFVAEGPLRLDAFAPPSTEALTDALRSGSEALEGLATDQRHRLALMARWFRRGMETLNQVDRLLFLYVALEVYPAVDDDDVPNMVAKFLSREAFAGLDFKVVKKSLQLGRIAGLRADIVHGGKDALEASEFDAFEDNLARLERVTRVCFAHLAGLPYDGSLDEWVIPTT